MGSGKMLITSRRHNPKDHDLKTISSPTEKL